MVGTSDKAILSILYCRVRLWMIIRFGAIDGSLNKTNLDEFKTTAQEKSSRFFFTISNFIIIIFIKSQLSLNSQINKEIESTSHDKRTLINDGYIYF